MAWMPVSAGGASRGPRRPSAGLDWWGIAVALSIHPQAVFDEYANLIEGTRTPAAQRPDLAVILTAGLTAEHHQRDGYGIDLDDLGREHPLRGEPTVRGIRDAARLLGDDVWIAVTRPGGYEGSAGDPLAGADVIAQLTSAAPGDLVWLTGALTHLAHDVDDEDEDGEDLDPLD